MSATRSYRPLSGLVYLVSYEKTLVTISQINPHPSPRKHGAFRHALHWKHCVVGSQLLVR